MPDKPDNNIITLKAPSDEGAVRELYDDFSSQYDHALSQWGYTAPDVVAEHLSHTVPLEQTILDAGCGTGLTGQALAKKGYTRITGTDLSAQSAKLARQTGHYEKVITLNLKEKLPFQTGHFGGVICVGVLSYIPKAKPLFKELLRVLKPGGTLAFTQREDLYQTYGSAELFNQLHATENFDRLIESTPKPYLPNNPNFAQTIGVHYVVWQKRLDSR